MPAWPLALACWLLPTLLVIGCFMLSVHLDLIEGCFPFTDGCTSISRACRKEPVIHLFRSVMLPTATLLAVQWLVVGSWLRQLGEGGRSRMWIVFLGVTGALFAILYGVFLGTDGPAYNLMRRYGVTVYFGFTALGELLLSARLWKLSAPLRDRIGTGLAGGMVAMAAGMLGLGLANVWFANYLDNDVAENVIEWWFALLMHGYFGLLAVAWYRWGLQIEARSPA
ncbi:MAG: hypothetical protein P8080_02155 [Gammaproteobacteria bacterium]